MEGMTKSAALEAASSGVRVNAVAPGPTETSMLNRFTGTAERKAALRKTVPLGRIGDPAEIASAAVFLASYCRRRQDRRLKPYPLTFHRQGLHEESALKRLRNPTTSAVSSPF